MIRIRLGDADRERIGCPEWLEYDPAAATLAEHRKLRQVGFSIQTLGERLQEQDLDAVAALVWLALVRAGADVSFEDLDFALAELEMRADDPNQSARRRAGQTSSKLPVTHR
jgi:hypothetical protein